MNDQDFEMTVELHQRYKMKLDPIRTDVVPSFKRMHGIRAVVFDIYGTLLISSSGEVGTTESSTLSELFSEALRTGNAKPLSGDVAILAESLYFEAIEQSHAVSRNKGIDSPEVDIVAIWGEVLRELKQQDLIASDVTITLCKRVAVSYEVRANPVALMPAAKETLTQLRDSGYLLGIVSNAQFFTPHLLSVELGTTLSLAGLPLDLCAFSWQTGCAKPSPAIFAPVLAHLQENHNVRPEEVLYVGNDMLNDIYTAAITGCRTCLFAGDRRSLRLRPELERCRDTQPDAVITDLGQISEILARAAP